MNENVTVLNQFIMYYNILYSCLSFLFRENFNDDFILDLSGIVLMSLKLHVCLVGLSNNSPSKTKSSTPTPDSEA